MKITLPILLTILIFFVSDFFSYKAINSAFDDILKKNLIAKIIFLSSSGIIIVFIVIGLLRLGSTPDAFKPNLFYPAIGLMILFVIPKLNITFFYLLDTISFFLIKKHHFLNLIGLSTSIILFLFILHGILINKTNFQVREQIISSEKIPKSFNNFKIIQLSDLHIGSFHKNSDAVKKIIKLTNAEKPDLIVFTGDMISNYAEEVDEFIPELSKLSAKYGKFAILGNHDYSDYVNWKTKEKKEENLNKLKQKISETGFILLNNENTEITVNHEKIQLTGVENWGLPPFPQLGNLNKSTSGLNENLYTILLSHDPSHWRAKVLKFPFIDLTLSGHTHAMQFGIEIGSLQFSPVKLKYKEWGGLYKSKNQNLYVNRGTGYIGFPGRAGIRPEITKIILKNK